MSDDDDPPEPLGAIDDQRLRLVFTCCHPALSMEARVALTLRLVAGLTVPEIARAFLCREPLRVIDEVLDWEPHPPEVLQAMRDHLEELKRVGVEAINA